MLMQIRFLINAALSLRRGILEIRTVVLFKPNRVRSLAEVRWNSKSCSGFA